MKRTVSTPHLVLGIIFAGLAVLWMIAQATDANIHDTAPGFPLVLIGAGAIGLVASLANARTRNGPTDETEVDEVEDDRADDTEATTVIEEY